ncbi:unnamed protein product [Kuraishia capsulata CBS 1993]|uniref:HTH TFE/IIEalpha-type domain-containing protein n=1 Tax=Kuraishia capsulata CBS 1993 TaxID=1382522 RepID=W6MTS4_9ASCO|nr:uncharacterized protein KUCA_T00005882001 [Kuraishia capsulata CBS 1993]CDK29888.1 unnamed protein product [Kuraishia capsulata CBS 1993]
MEQEIVTGLIRFVSRAFYGKQYVLILDALLVHSVLSEDDLIFLLNIQRKNLRALCNKLVEDRFAVSHVQKEEGPQQRLITRTYFYIHHIEAIDAIKWKMHTIVKMLTDEMSHDSDPQGYICPTCRTKYSQLDAISMLSEDKMNFLCDLCGDILIEDDTGIQAKKRQEKLSKLMSQLDPVITYLKKIDDMYIEDNTFESSLTKAIPAQSTPLASYSVSTATSKRQLSQSLQNAARRSQATLHVRITANDENALKEQDDLEKKKAKLLQNAMPSWHSESTVGKESLGKLEEDAAETFEPEYAADEDEKDDIKEEDTSATTEATAITSTGGLEDTGAEDVLAAYYAQLAERQKKEDEDDEKEGFEDDEEFADDDFEDVDVMMEDEEPESSIPSSMAVEPATSAMIEVEEFDGESDEE